MPQRTPLPAALPPRGPTTRAAPPASEGLPPARRRSERATRRRRAHPANTKRPKAEKTNALVAAAAEVLTTGIPAEKAAVSHGVDASGKSVSALVKSAREIFARRAEFYVQAHARAAIVAAERGDASPAEWALERISEGGERIVDPPKSAQGTSTVSIGIALGGIPQAAHQTVETTLVTPQELPKLEPSVVAEELMP